MVFYVKYPLFGTKYLYIFTFLYITIYETGKKVVEAFELQIRKYRLLRKLTQKQLARLSNISQQYISELEQGVVRTKSPTLDTVKKLASALNVCPYALIKPDTCNLNHCECTKMARMPLPDEFLNFAAVAGEICKEKNISINTLLDKAAELIKKEYSN